MKQGFWSTLCCLMVVMFCINTVHAAPVASGQWDVPLLGVMQGPEGFAVVDVETWIQQLEPILSANMKKKDKSVPGADIGKIAKEKWPPELKVYQLQVNSGNAYHLAWALIFEDKGKKIAQLDNFFTKEQEMAKDQEKFVAELNGILLEGIKKVEEGFEETGFVTVAVANLVPLSQMAGSSEIIYTLGGRLIINSKGMIVPLYGKAYFLNRGGKLISAIIVTPDADGEFWSEVTDQLFLSIEH